MDPPEGPAHIGCGECEWEGYENELDEREIEHDDGAVEIQAECPNCGVDVGRPTLVKSPTFPDTWVDGR
jgi:hypothetical protein